MFYKITLQRTVTVPPHELNGTLPHRLLSFLRTEVEGKPLPTGDSIVTSASLDYKSAAKSSAMVIAVLRIVRAEALQGKVLDDGNVAFRMTYDALVLKLHRGEVLDVMVTRVGQEGWWGNVFGVGKIFISHTQMSVDTSGQPEWVYENDGAEGSWVAHDGARSIKVNDVVRVRVLAETPQSQGAMAVGTMAGMYLGPV